MYQSQQHTPKIPTRLVILKKATKYISCKDFSEKYGINKPLVVQTMGNLYREGHLIRIPCDCGKGFLYKVRN